MSRYIALLRGVNVSGSAMRMAALKESFAALGFDGVQTYLQSGNVVFDTKQADPLELAKRIEGRIKEDFGMEIPVLVLTAGEVAAIARNNPLFPESGGTESHFHCTFLFGPVTDKAFSALKLPAAEGERAVLAKDAVLLHCPHGYGRTKLNNTYFEKALGVKATTRNWKTVLALRDLSA
jgi:uncharacterized protein (DUF1697 family)